MKNQRGAQEENQDEKKPQADVRETHVYVDSFTITNNKRNSLGRVGMK